MFSINRVHSPSGKHVMTQFTIIEVFGWALRLHLFYAADTEGFHSHPRSFASVCLAGGYTEYLWGNPIPNRVTVGSVVVRSATDTHRVVPQEGKTTVTLAVVSPVKNKWQRVQPAPRIVLWGLPCSGKGTHGRMLAERYGVPHISIGDEVRKILLEPRHPYHSRLLRHIEQADGGFAPLPDEWAQQICAAAIADKKVFVLDGFPRNVLQMDALDVRPTNILLLAVSEETSFIRSVFRGRNGDSESKTLQRIALDAERLQELELYTQKWGLPFARVNCEGLTIEQAFAEIVWAIEGKPEIKSGEYPHSTPPKNPKNYRNE